MTQPTPSSRTRWLACLLALAPFAASCAQALATLNLGHQFARDSIPGRTAHKFAELLGASSQGRLVVAVHPAATFGDERLAPVPASLAGPAGAAVYAAIKAIP